VIPVGQFWDKITPKFPKETWWSADGNHSASTGGFLAASVIARYVTGDFESEATFLPVGQKREVQVSLEALLKKGLR
jgi:hypothetical protein